MADHVVDLLAVSPVEDIISFCQSKTLFYYLHLYTSLTQYR